MVDALTQGDLDTQHPLFNVVAERLKGLQKQGVLRAGSDIEIRAYSHLGAFASTLLFEKQHRGEDVDKLAERFAREWSRLLEHGMYKK